jgi:hypothetical protein
LNIKMIIKKNLVNWTTISGVDDDILIQDSHWIKWHNCLMT